MTSERTMTPEQRDEAARLRTFVQRIAGFKHSAVTGESQVKTYARRIREWRRDACNLLDTLPPTEARIAELEAEVARLAEELELSEICVVVLREASAPTKARVTDLEEHLIGVLHEAEWMVKLPAINDIARASIQGQFARARNAFLANQEKHDDFPAA